MQERNTVVYLHKDVEGVVRYVGSGCRERATQNCAKSKRGKLYTDFVQRNGKLNVEIVTEYLTKIEAEDLERELYDLHVSTILNFSRPVSYKIMTKEMFDEYLYYDETSASCLRWRVSPNVRIKVDSEAGNLHAVNGYWQICLNGNLYQAHRIVAVLHDLNVEGKVVDHIDRNRENNKIENLRVVTQKENSNNKNLSSNNTSGVRGVHFDKQQNRWRVSWYENQKRKRTSFPVANYESHEAAFRAAVEYKNEILKLKQST